MMGDFGMNNDQASFEYMNIHERGLVLLPENAL